MIRRARVSTEGQNVDARVKEKRKVADTRRREAIRRGDAGIRARVAAGAGAEQHHALDPFAIGLV
ncbi:MAG: hypothetical protein ABSE69_02060 [Roseiarcus sp.]|jgi:hypothetical protein